MLDLSPEKLFLVGVIALIVLGPNRLPGAARTLGRFVSSVRHMSSGFQEEVRSALAEPVEAVNSVVAEFRIPDVRGSVREAVVSSFTGPAAAPTTPGTPASPSSPASPSAPASPASPAGSAQASPASPTSAGSSDPGPASGSTLAAGAFTAPDDPSLN